MKRIFIAGLIAVAAIGVASLYAGKTKTIPAKPVKAATPSVGLEVGMTAPDFVMNDQNGTPLMLQQFRGKTVVLDFWATWCGPCRRALPHFKELWSKYRAKDVIFLGISLDKDVEKWKQFIKNENMDWYHVGDGKFWQNAVAQQYGVESIPSVWVLDKSGVILGKDLHGADVETTIQKALTAKPAKQAKPSKS